MTNTSVNSIKVPKKKGPIRFEAIVPLCIIVALIWIYFFLFFDGHVRSAIEWGAGKAVGAEVDVASVKTSFLNGSFALNGLQITDREKPTTNMLEIGRMHFQFSWDALLRVKFVVNDASIDHFQVGTPRARAGWVAPEEKAKAEESAGGGGSSALTEANKFLQGADPLKDLKDVGNLDNLQSLKKINELQAELKTKEQQWKQALSQMPQGNEISDLQNRIRNVKIGGTNNPIEIQAQVQNVQNLINETNDKINKVKNTGNQINQDIQNFQKSIQDVEKLVQKDREALEQKLKLPSLDVKSLSMQFFGQALRRRLGDIEKYWNMAQKYMPAANSKDERASQKGEPIVAHPRARGKVIEFPMTTGYPLFWLKRAGLSSKAEGSPFGGEVSGELRDVASNPRIVGRPTVLEVKADFPQQQIQGIVAKFVVDQTKAQTLTTFKGVVATFPVTEQMLSQSDDVQFGFKKATGTSDFSGQIQSGVLNFHSMSRFNQIDYLVGAKTKELDDVLKGAVADLKEITVQAKAEGPFSSLNMDVQSNLGSALQKGFEKSLKSKIDEARKKLDDLIQSKIKGPQKDLQGQFGGAQGQVNQAVQQKQKEVDGVKGQAEGKLKEAQNQAAGGVQKGVEDLKKKFGF